MTLNLMFQCLLFSLTMSILAHAAYVKDDNEIRARLCPRMTCASHYPNEGLHSCDVPLPLVTIPQGQDFVFGIYRNGEVSCLCPCNFSKFYQ